MNSESQFEHRIHLDAIRGLACIAVVLFHCEVPGFSNGFVGVDVFFVLSGYLISSKLLRELVSNGGLDVAGFYCRRFKRLFPASAAVLIVTAMLYKIFEIPKLVSEHKMSFVAASLYFQNWHNLRLATDYFAISVSQESPVLHYWSLSVEEQFYFVLPFVLLALFKLPVREKLKFCLRFTFSLLVVLVIVNINMWSSTPALSHFSTFGRMYQLASGMFLALIILDDERTNFIRSRLEKLNTNRYLDTDSVSLILLIISALIVATSNLKPAMLGMVVTFFTFTVLLLLEYSKNQFLKVAILHNKCLCLVGKISYGMYLTHVPISKFCDIMFIFSNNYDFYPNYVRASIVLALTLLVSFCMWYLLEEPLMRKIEVGAQNSSRTLLTFAVLTLMQTLIVLTILTSSSETNQTVQTDSREPQQLSQTCKLLEKLGSVFLTGDSFTKPWLFAFSTMHEKCGLTSNFEYIWQHTTPYLPVESTYSIFLDRQIDVLTYQNKSYNYIRNNEPNVTLFFIRSIYGSTLLSYRNYSSITPQKNDSIWQKLIAELFVDLIQIVAPHTTPFFVLNHAEPKMDPTKCIRNLRIRHKDWLRFSNECDLEVVNGKNFQYVGLLLEKLKTKFRNVYTIDSNKILFGNTSDSFRIPMIEDGVEVFHDKAHLSEQFALKKLHLLTADIVRQLGV